VSRLLDERAGAKEVATDTAERYMKIRESGARAKTASRRFFFMSRWLHKAAEVELLRRVQPLYLRGAIMGLQVSIRESGDITILDLQGISTIDGGESNQLTSLLKELVDNGARKMLLNLADLSRVDSSGVSVFVEVCRSLRKRGGDMKFLCPHGQVLEVFRPLHLLEIIPSFENETQALASFRDYPATH